MKEAPELALINASESAVAEAPESAIVNNPGPSKIEKVFRVYHLIASNSGFEDLDLGNIDPEGYGGSPTGLATRLLDFVKKHNPELRTNGEYSGSLSSALIALPLECRQALR